MNWSRDPQDPQSEQRASDPNEADPTDPPDRDGEEGDPSAGGSMSRYGVTVRVALTLGFASLSAALLVAHYSPADGYELSIYAGTPVEFWAFATLALVLGLVGSVYGYGTDVGRLAMLLEGGTVASFFALPLIRGYHFYGTGDAMVHLGVARNLASGAKDFWTLFYPGSHSVAIFVGNLVGWSIPRSMVFVTLLFVLTFLLFVPLSVREVTGDPRAVHFGTFAALLLMPINNVSTHPTFHTFSMTILFFPFVVYLLFKHTLHGQGGGALPSHLTATGLVLPVAMAAMVVFHPQAALNAVLLMGAIAIGQFVHRRVWPDHPINSTRGLYGQTVVSIVIFYQWASGHWQLGVTAQKTVTSMLQVLSGTASNEEIQSQAQSAQQIGVSLKELYVKVFLVETLFVIVSAIAVVWVVYDWRRRSRRHHDYDTAVTYFAFGGAVLLPFTLVQFAALVDHNFFRQIGLGMVLVTVLAAVGLYRTGESLGGARATLRPVLVVTAAVLVCFSVVTVFPSPFVYKYNKHVTEAQMEGYERAFEQQPEGIILDSADLGRVWFGGIRAGFKRHRLALSSKPGTYWSPGPPADPKPVTSGPVRSEAIQQGLPTHYATHEELISRRDHWVIVTELDRERAVYAYDELRFSREDFTTIRRTDDVSRVYDNEELTKYYVDIDGNGSRRASGNASDTSRRSSV